VYAIHCFSVIVVIIDFLFLPTFMFRYLFLAFIFFPSLVFAADVPVRNVHLAVPFSSQAPEGVWWEPWQNACEETSITMIDAFYAGYELPTAVAKDGILKTIRLKESVYGASLDEPADEIVGLINAFFTWEAKVVSSPTVEDMIAEIDAGRPIILPVNGPDLQNRFFQTSQLDYHVVVLSGYDRDAEVFIAQDPGTQFGKEYRYSFKTVLRAMHDFVPHDTQHGAAVAIFTSPVLVATANTDGDNDGLTKQKEIEYGTVLWLADSDGDGYFDGEEVDKGYLPTLNEQTISNGSVIKEPNDPHVYVLSHGYMKQHVLNAASFLRRGFAWSDIVVVSHAFLERLFIGPILD